MTKELIAIHRPTQWQTAGEHFRPSGALVAGGLEKQPNSAGGALAMVVVGGYRGPHGRGIFQTWLTVDAEAPNFYFGGRKYPQFISFPARLSGPDGIGPSEKQYGQPPLSFLLPPMTEQFFNDNHPSEGLRLSVPAALRLKTLAEAEEGDLAAASGLFVRALYFSASTVTTLGIGDIQPITPLARMLVTLEAIFGLVFIGLFLNALAHHARPDVARHAGINT